MDENTGTTTTYDKSGNDYDGTMEGSMTESDWEQGKYGSGLNFDGTDDIIRFVGSSAPGHDLDFTAGPFTIEAWINAETASGTVLGKRDGGTYCWPRGQTILY